MKCSMSLLHVLAALPFLSWTVGQAQTELQRKSIVPRFEVVAPIGEVLDWDKYFVFEEVAGTESYIFDVIHPGSGSCVTSNDGLTIGSSGGSFTRELSTVSPPAAPEVECAQGQCKARLFFALNYVEPSAGAGSRCRVAFRTYYWTVRTKDGHYTDKIEFKPRLSKYDF